MNERIKWVVAIDYVFIFLMLCSGSANGILGNLIYYIAFLFPIAIGIYFIIKTKDDAREGLKLSLGISPEGIKTALPAILPIIAVTALISLLTAKIMGAFGITNETSFSEPIFIAIILHALIPTLLEETLFRYIPMKLLSKEGTKSIILSALLFSLAHANLFQIPYAFIAGVLFAILNYASGSILPSLVIHFLNNTISLLSIYEYIGKTEIIVFAVLVIISFVFLIIGYKNYKSKIRNIFSGKLTFDKNIIVYSALMLFLAVTNLFA